MVLQSRKSDIKKQAWSYKARQFVLKSGAALTKRQSFMRFLKQILVFMWNSNSCEIAPYGKSSICFFQEFLASGEKKFILTGRLGTSF